MRLEIWKAELFLDIIVDFYWIIRKLQTFQGGVRETRHPSIITVAILYMNSNYFAIATCKIQQNDYNNY